MDITGSAPTVLSLCTGYGGIERGLNMVFGEVSVLAYVEVEAFAIANLVSKMEAGRMVPAPIWTDVKTLESKVFRGCIDILIGGYPCQPFSAAGKRKGERDPRHLWPYIRKAIFGSRPKQVFFENVEGHLSMGVDKVLKDLERMGYRLEVGLFSATEIGAPHPRKRVFILGQLANAGHLSGCAEFRIEQKEYAEKLRGGAKLADATVKRPQERGNSGSLPEQKAGTQATLRGIRDPWPTRPGENQHTWEEPRTIEPGLGGAINGTPYRVDRLRLTGAGVVPQTAAKAYVTLSQLMESNGTS